MDREEENTQDESEAFEILADLVKLASHPKCIPTALWIQKYATNTTYQTH